MNPTDQEIRTWARNNGYQVGERGRLQENVKTAYHRANSVQCLECYQYGPMHHDWCSKKGGQVETVETTYVEEFPAEEEWQTVTLPPVPAPIPVASTPALTVESTPNSADATFSALVAQIASTAVSALPASLDETRVREIAEEVAINAVSELSAPKVYEIHVGDAPVKVMDGPTHQLFEKVTKIVGAGLHVYLVGPPGTGKTTLASQVADALSLQFGMISCDPTMPASKLFGFVDAGGEYRKTVFRDCYENGGVFLFDELDNAHPGIIASINGAIANGHCPFPDGMVKRNESFRCVAAANTFGTGATRQFVGRNQLDAATLDRFVTVVVGIDETLEEALTYANCPENVQIAREWLAKVRGWRGDVGDLQVIISPRAAIEGARLLSIGFTMDECAEMKVWKGIDASTRAKIERGY
jgi:cobaltochelatase CobS